MKLGNELNLKFIFYAQKRVKKCNTGNYSITGRAYYSKF